VGDNVRIAVIDEAEKTGNIEEILPRKSELVRPAVANVDMALVIFAAARPDPNFNLLDRFLCMMEYQKLPVTICFNKSDLVTEEERQALVAIYGPAGYELLFVSAESGENLDALRAALSGRTTTVAGPSGVGKSTLVNHLQSTVHMETGAISEKIERGKHTTRHSQLIPIAADTYIVDTPGFSSMDLPELEKDALWTCYPEFIPHEPSCRFVGCSHIGEPDCGVKEAVESGEISRTRYENYVLLYEEIKNHKKY
jgi:ribosome biogenesis GTPase